MEHSVQVIVKYGNNENKSDIIQFTTNETGKLTNKHYNSITH